MADPKKSLNTNAEGDFFVDSTCIDCDACRQIAPSIFAEAGDHSCVAKQPESEEEIRKTWQAILACPVGSIGSLAENRALEIQADFPLRVSENIYYCGFNSKDSYGANSYFIVDERGNWLIESPRYLKKLAARLKDMGGISYIFLSHRDDVADADKYASEFKAKRIIHKADLAAQPSAELVIEGNEPLDITEDFKVIPTPGHSMGHCVLLYKNKYLFTGDHLYFDRTQKRLAAFERYCWYSWEVQKESMKLLLSYDFEWVIPGHGQRVQLGKQEMKTLLKQLIDSM